MKRALFSGTLVILGVMTLVPACAPQPPSPPPPPAVTNSAPELKYLLVDRFPDIFYVDSDFYPVAREGQEEQNARQQFPIIRTDSAEFSAILKRLALPEKAEYTPDEMLAVYREHKKLTLGIELTASGDAYNFALRTGEGQGERIEGIITKAGKITVTKREPSFNTLPICLTAGTLIDTPAGQRPVEQLKPGMAVWSLDETGRRIAIVIAKVSATPVPSGFQVVKVTLSDGRSFAASPDHPTAVGRAIGDYGVGEALDGAVVADVQFMAYDGGATYDILPASATRLYRANGVWLMSTLTE